MKVTEQSEFLHAFAVWMLGSRPAALDALREVTAIPDLDDVERVQKIVATLIAAEKPARIDRFAELEDILRTNPTVPVDLGHPLVRGDARRLAILLSELQRTCLLTAVRALPAGRRAVFILRHILGLSVDACAAACGTSQAAVQVTESRARKSLEDYLGARCGHLDAGNVCHCTGRLGGALEYGFVTWPTHDDHIPGARAQGPYREVTALYRQQPRIRLPVIQATPPPV